MADFVTEPRTYKNVSVLIKNYFTYRCQAGGYTEFRGCWKEDETLSALGYKTYTIEVWARECDDIMQRIMSEANDYEGQVRR